MEKNQTLIAEETKAVKKLCSKVRIVFAPTGQVIVYVNEERDKLSSGNLVVLCPNFVDKLKLEEFPEKVPYIKVLRGKHEFFIPLRSLKLNEKQKNDLIKTTGGYFHQADFDKPFPIHFRGLPLLN